MIREQINKIDEQIAKLKVQREELEQEWYNFELLPESYRLADILHGKRCRHNHTDGCGWHYESWTNIGHSRRNWIEEAEKVLDKMKYVDAVEALRILG